MSKSSPAKTVVLFLSLIALVVILSMISGRLWGGKPETLPEHSELTIEKGMTLKDFGSANGLPNSALKVIFGLQSKSDLQKKLFEYGTANQIKSLVIKKLALAAEHESKNWVKILIKFCLWFAFLITLFLSLRKRKISPTLRKTALFISVLIFGVIMGADPSPMGTVKDAIHLYGSTGAIFPPRMIALMVFLVIVFVANKYICAWGCQFGVLQDLIFRLNQTAKTKTIMGRQVKIPFILSNSIRLIFLGVFTIGAFVWSFDIIGPFDPFKIYKPAFLGMTGVIFVGILLIMSLFIYRPWCHFFCPFGLVGWLVEKVSLIRISVDYETCIACQKCATACPSTVMGAILRQDKKTIPDCFACYACREICPTESIRFSTRKRTILPPGHFDEKKQSKTNIQI
ncbi:MAG: 4Fe-4S binding protein [Deltaproteobacteria bacterium]|nr:4Fe-4S binding protein [Deltaproteobacteria bacterium]